MSENRVVAQNGVPAKLSLAMIVRDCDTSLRQALASAQPFVGEMVVVDTGSVDRTPDVARELGAKVFHFPWCDDFSAARNYSLEQATGDWIFWMDADDVLPPESGHELRRLIDGCPQRNAAFWVQVEQEVPGPAGKKRTVSHGHLKLFPRHSQIRFRYRVHEQVVPAIQELGLRLKPSQAKVRHVHADRSVEGEARRIERNLRLLELDLAERPDDAFVHLNLGMTYLDAPGGLPRAIDFLRRSLNGFKPGNSVRTNAWLALAKAHRQAGDLEAELDTLRSALAESPDDASLLWRLGVLLERRGQIDEAADCLHRLLRRGKLHLSVIHSPDIPARAAIRLGELYVRQGLRHDAERLWADFLKRFPDARAVRNVLEHSYLQSHGGVTRQS